MTSDIMIGVVARTGSAVAVAVSGPAAAPRFLARREIELVPEGLAAQPYHAAAGLDLTAAAELIARVEAAAENAAAAGLRALSEAALSETGLAETGLSETGLAETGLSETGLAETGLAETGLAETGLAEAGLAETGLAETGLAEAGLSETGLAEAGPAGAVRAVAVVVKPVAVPGDLAGILRSHAWMHAAEGVLYRQAVLAAAAECGWTARAVEQSALPAAEQALGVLAQAAGRPWRRIEKDAARAALTQLSGQAGRR